MCPPCLREFLAVSGAYDLCMWEILGPALLWSTFDSSTPGGQEDKRTSALDQGSWFYFSAEWHTRAVANSSTYSRPWTSFPSFLDSYLLKVGLFCAYPRPSKAFIPSDTAFLNFADEKRFWNSELAAITNFTRNSLNEWLFPGDFLSVSRWAPFVAHILRVFSFLGNPGQHDSVGESAKDEGQRQSSAWCRGLIRA